MNMFDDCDTIEEIIGQAIGAGSTCWNNLVDAGEFDSARAVEIFNDAVEAIRERAFIR